MCDTPRSRTLQLLRAEAAGRAMVFPRREAALSNALVASAAQCGTAQAAVAVVLLLGEHLAACHYVRATALGSGCGPACANEHLARSASFQELKPVVSQRPPHNV